MLLKVFYCIVFEQYVFLHTAFLYITCLLGRIIWKELSFTLRSSCVLSFDNKASRMLCLSITLLLGLLLGAWFLINTSLISAFSFVSFMKPSFFSLLVTACLPFIFSHIIFSYFGFYFLLPYVFCKAFLHMYCIGGVTLAYGSAGWLVSLLLQFSNSILFVVLFWYWYKQLLRGSFRSSQDTLICCLLSIFIISIDYTVVCPFAISLLNH